MSDTATPQPVEENATEAVELGRSTWPLTPPIVLPLGGRHTNRVHPILTKPKPSESATRRGSDLIPATLRERWSRRWMSVLLIALGG